MTYDKVHSIGYYHEIVECLTGALDAKDSSTAGHSFRVSNMCVAICDILGTDVNTRDEIHMAAHLHDIGKIGIPDKILLKPEGLTDLEWSIMKSHPQIGADILGKSEALKDLQRLVRHHHERYDGKGYPFGLAGEEIPFGARVIAIADSIDAMLSKRSYRDAQSEQFCREEIDKNRSIMYDPDIAAAVVKEWEYIITSRKL